LKIFRILMELLAAIFFLPIALMLVAYLIAFLLGPNCHLDESGGAGCIVLGHAYSEQLSIIVIMGFLWLLWIMKEGVPLVGISLIWAIVEIFRAIRSKINR
jgi:hypothetical protein